MPKSSRGPSRTHYDLITPQTYRVAECSLSTLNRLDVPYVLVGGWGVATYGSVVPSVDTDVYLHRQDRDRVVKEVEGACGFVVNRSETLELLDWDDTTSVLSLDLDLGSAELGFRPDRLFQAHPPVVEELRLPNRPPIPAKVPDAHTLLFLKLCAFRSRRFYWEANRDPTLLARMDVVDRNTSREKTLLHWERKAGKDLFDCAFLVLAGADPANGRTIADEWNLRPAFGEALRDIPPILDAYAMDLAPPDGPTMRIREAIGRIQKEFS